jgi:BirA family transcriptional regulator, biotin operon repressor / biotin---[acetyl-CoA-carboxylase] ligase
MDGMPDSQYTDLSRPPLRESALQRALVAAGGLWSQVRVVTETGSTNADVAEAARSGAPEGLVLVAERQTAGRGRMGRDWQAPPRAGITVSVLFRPEVPAHRLGWVPLLAGVSVVDAVGRIAVVDTALKWPNDVLARPATGDGPYGKCAGILAEGLPSAVVLGLGLNVSQRADELPTPPASAPLPPTSLALVDAACTDRDPLLRAILRRLAGWYDRWRDADGDADACGLRDAYRECCVTIGVDVLVTRPGGEAVRGLASDVDADGRLVVATADGLQAMAAGDVHHVRLPPARRRAESGRSGEG